jgi:hypothetical protein
MKKFSKTISQLAVLRAAKLAFRNRQLTYSQIEIWKRGTFEAAPGEATAIVDIHGTSVQIAVRREHDKRPSQLAAAG